MTWKRVLAAVAVLALVLWQVFAVHTWGAEKVQGRVAVLTAATAVVFIALYSRDPWWKSWFGRSLMLVAVAFFLYGLSVVLFRNFGDYPGRDVLIVVAQDASFAAMVMRTAVLWGAQRADEHKTNPLP